MRISWGFAVLFCLIHGFVSAAPEPSASFGRIEEFGFGDRKPSVAQPGDLLRLHSRKPGHGSAHRAIAESYSRRRFDCANETDPEGDVTFACNERRSKSKSSTPRTKHDNSTLVFPNPPSGASLVQFRPSQATSATVPMFVSHAWPKASEVSLVTSAYVALHGRERNGAQAFSDIYDAVKAAGARIDEADAHALVISPTFYITTDAQKPDQQGRVKNYFDPQRNFAWLSDSQSNGTYGLFDGADAVAPKRGRVSDLLNDVRVSSYDVLDALVAHFADEARFPRLRNLTFAGHSAGAQAFQRWSAINPRSLPSSTSGIGPDGRIHVRFVLANAPSSVYFTTDRPDNPNGATRTSQRTRKDGSISKTGCAFNQWRYGLDGAQPRYVRKRQAEPNDGKELFAQWIRKDVVRLVGTEDTKENANGGDQSCAVRTQGGDNRCERGYAYWAYQNLLAGTGEDVSSFYGYTNLSLSVKSLPGLKDAHAHRLGIVSGVGHNGGRMFSSAVGTQALLSTNVEPGPRPPPAPGAATASGTSKASFVTPPNPPNSPNGTNPTRHRKHHAKYQKSLAAPRFDTRLATALALSLASSIAIGTALL